MLTSTMYFKVVTRKLQGGTRAFQFLLLAGATPTLSHSTADFMETLSPNHVLKQEEIVAAVAKLQKIGNYSDTKNITNPDVEKKLAKVFDIGSEGCKGVVIPSFAALGIGSYL
jgi:hypothetical protein